MTGGGRAVLRPAIDALYAAALVLMSAPSVGAIRSFGPAIELADLVFAAAAGLWVLAVLRGELTIPRTGAWIAAAAYFLVAALSLLVTPSLRVSGVKLFALAYLITLMVMTASLGVAPGGWRRVLVPWIVAAGLTAALGLGSVVLFYLGVRDRATNVFLWGYGTVPVGNYPRIAVFFENANMLCNYLIVGAGAAAALLPLVSGRARAWVLAAALAMGAASLFTLSAGIGGLAIGIAIVWIGWGRGQRLLVSAGAAATALLFTFLSVVNMVPRGTGAIRFGPVDLDLSASGRVSNWQGALDTIRARPLIGLGLGTLVAPTSNPRAFHSMEAWDEQAKRDTTTRPMEAHNVWLNVTGQLGLPGLLAFVALVVLLLRGLWPPGGAIDPWSRARIALCGAASGALLYQGLFAAIEDSRQVWYLFGLIVAAKTKRP